MVLLNDSQTLVVLSISLIIAIEPVAVEPIGSSLGPDTTVGEPSQEPHSAGHRNNLRICVIGS